MAARTVAMHLQAIATDRSLMRNAVLDSIRAADREVAHLAARRRSQMGTTVTGLAALGDGSDSILVFNVGDSRVYRLRDSALERLTHDHSVVQELIDARAIDASEAESHPDRHVITRSLGSGDTLDIDWWQVHALVGDRYLVASDGLTRELGEVEITQSLDNIAEPATVAEELVRRAVDAGGSDNVTVVVVDVAAATPERDDPLDVDTAELSAFRSGLDDTTPRGHASSSIESAGGIS